MSSGTKPTKNDEAWEKLFEQHQILEQVRCSGHYRISSADINEVRESRLMAKFDPRANLPCIFRKHALSILPVSRSEYVIGPFRTHAKVDYSDDVEVESMRLPGDLDTIDYTNLYSEASALNCAHLADIFTDLVGEKTYHTVSGRMSTDRFTFAIEGTDSDRTPHTLNVDNSQCEVDAGFEGTNHFVLVEAKNFAVDDFLVRQLYYPYRL
jgi:hypothetical protein